MPTCVDLFCGAGGLTQGFATHGFDPVYAVDSDSDSVATYAANFGEVAVASDISDVNFTGIEAEAVLAGLPCQGFSPLGRRIRKKHVRNGLWRHFFRAIKEIRPEAFAAENVPGFLTSWAYRELRRLTRKLGYATSATVLNAVDFDVPQRRRRAFVVGLRGETPVPISLPKRDGGRTRTVRDAIGDLPSEITWEGMDRTSRPGDLMVERMSRVPLGGSRFDLPDELLPPCWRKNSKSATDVFGRLKWDEPSVTIRTCFIHPEKGRYVHPDANRAITLREGARLQAFPDKFEFVGSMTSIARQIGNAVPPPLACVISEAVDARLSA